jgi:hypothetical protein
MPARKQPSAPTDQKVVFEKRERLDVKSVRIKKGLVIEQKTPSTAVVMRKNDGIIQGTFDCTCELGQGPCILKVTLDSMRCTHPKEHFCDGLCCLHVKRKKGVELTAMILKAT